MSEIVDCIAWIVRKTCWSLAVFFRFVAYRLLDLLGLIFNLLACATIVRLPAMVMQFSDMDDLWEWRFMGLVQFLIFLSDIPIFLMACIILITIWRVYPCYNELRKEWDGKFKRHGIYYSGCDIRIVIAKHFFTLFIDVVCVPTGLICLLSWRSKIFINRIRDASNDWKRRKYCFVEFLHLLIDIPLLFCFAICLLSWRLPFVLRHIQKDRTKKRSWTHHIRYRGIQNLYYLFLDLPCVIMFCICCVTWRLPFVVRRIKQPTSIWKKRTQKKMRIEIALEFLSIFADIPCMIVTVIVVITAWRFYFLVQKLKKIFSKCKNRNLNREDEMEIRLACSQQFALLFIDILCFILFLIVLITLWRLYPLVMEIKKYSKQYGNWRKQQDRMENKSININASTEELSTSREETNNESPTTTENALKTCTLSTCMWKIRKSICINFGMIFVDAPAIVLFILLLLTVLRTSKVISAVIGSGNFYLLFAVTVYYEAALFFVDLLFFCLFLLLVIGRPIAVWVHLLEDEEHKKSRILREEIIPWGSDITEIKDSCLKRMNDGLNIAIKERKPYSETRNQLENIFSAGFFEKLSDLSLRLEEHQIQEEYVNILNAIKFYESNRVPKLMRKFLIESVYLSRPDVSLHNMNVATLREEMRIFNSKLTNLYKQLNNYEPEKIPLYDEKCGLKIRSSHETKKVLIKCLTQGNFVFALLLIIACLPLYRAPRMLISLYRRWCARSSIVKETMKEYLLDLLAFIQALFVIILLYRAPFMFVDIADCIIERRSVKAVRSVIKKYPPEIAEDFSSLLSFIFSWNTPRLFFTTILFAVLMPADLFLTVIRLRYNDKCKAYFFTILMYLFFVSFPFIIVYYASKELLDSGNGWINIVVLCVFYSCLLAVMTALIFGILQNKNHEYLLEVPQADYVRFSWYNVHVFIFEFLEFLQGVALVYKLANIPMYGGNTLHSASEYILFSFFSFKTVFWITVALFCIWFLICGAPIILENVLETLTVGSCSKRSSWRLAVSLFANTLFITMVESFMSMTSCNYHTCPSLSSGLVPLMNMTQNNYTCVLADLVDDKSMSCWTDAHAPYSLFGMLGVTWYASTAIIFTAKYGDPSTFEQDIGFSPVYNTIINIMKGFMVMSITIITEENYVALGLFILFNLLAIIFSLCFRAMFKYQPCNFLSVLVWRIFSFGSAIIAAISVLVAYLMDDIESKVPLIILGVGILMFFIFSVFCAVKLLQESEIIKHRNNFRKDVLVIETKISKNDWFIESWKDEATTWKRLVTSVNEASKVDRNLNPENWNIDLIFNGAAVQDTEVPDYVKPPPLPPVDSDIEYQPPPMPTPIVDNNAHPNELDSTVNQNTVSIDDDSANDNSNNYLENEPIQSNDEEQENVIINDDTEGELSNDTKSNDTEITEDLHNTEMSRLYQQQGDYNSINDINVTALPSENVEDETTNNTVEAIHEINELKYNIVKLEKNGRNLLLMLEKHVRYDAFRYSFLSQRNHWLNAVWQSNWQGLSHCLKILESNLQGSYDKPSQLDIQLSPSSLPSDQLQHDPHDTLELPPKIKKLSKPEIIEFSNNLRLKIIEEIKVYTNYGNELSKIFEKLLPELPVLMSWKCDETGFELICRRSTSGVITEIDEGGNKLAKGASFTLGKQLSGNFSETGITFPSDSKSVVGKKGPVSAAVKELLFLSKGETLYVSVNGKKVKYEMLMASCKTIRWN